METVQTIGSILLLAWSVAAIVTAVVLVAVDLGKR